MEAFVGSCVACKVQSKIQHRNSLRSTYFLSIYFQWILDLVIMPYDLWDMRYLVLAQEELSNFLEGKAIRTKAILKVC